MDIDLSVIQEDSMPGRCDTPGVYDHALREIEALQATNPVASEHMKTLLKRHGAQIVVPIAPHRIRCSKFANRHEASFTLPAFDKLKAAIRLRGGNSQPIVVRPVNNATASAGDLDQPLYEIISGHRRHRACRELGLEVNAIIVPAMNDLELTRSMHDENHARANISPYESGCMFQMWLDQNLYPSQNKLAEAIGRSPADVSRALALATLPEAVIKAFLSPLVLQFKDADTLKEMLNLDREAVLQAAATLANSEPKKSRSEVLCKLDAASKGEGGVGSTNTPQKTPLKIKNECVGVVAWDAQGMATVTLTQQFPLLAQQELEKSLPRLITKAMSKAKRNMPPADPSATQPAAV